MDRLKKIIRATATAFGHASIALLVAGVAWATTIANGESGSSVRTKLNRNLLQTYNVLDYGATCVGSGHDDTVGIQAAITAAVVAGGGDVYVPPTVGGSVYCNTTAALTFTGGSGVNSITMRGVKGEDVNGSKIYGNFAGTTVNVSGAASNAGAIRLTVSSTAAFNNGMPNSDLLYVYVANVGGVTAANGYWGITIDDATHVTLNGSTFSGSYTSGGTMSLPGYIIDNPDTGGSTNLSAVIGLQIKNTNAAGGGIRMGGVITGEITNCTVTGTMIGIMLATNAYNIDVRSSVIVGTGLAAETGIGILMSQNKVDASSVTLWKEGIRAFNGGSEITATRFEQNLTAIVVGRDPSNSLSQQSGISISALEGESNETFMRLDSVSGLNFSGNLIQGTVAPNTAYFTGSISGTTMTVTAINTGQGQGQIDSAPIRVGMIAVTGHGASASTTILSQLTGSTGSTGTYSVNNSQTVGSQTLAFHGVQYGIRVIGVSNSWFAGNSMNLSAQIAGTDLGSPSGANDNVTFSSMGGSWIMPPQNLTPTFYASSYRFINSNNPTAAFTFANLPATPVQGMVFDVTDLQPETVGMEAFGSGAVKGQVYYDGAHWLVSAVDSRPRLFSAVPTVNQQEGWEYNVTDCAIAGGVWGGAVTGGGMVHCKMRWNGSGWTAMGK